jgi:hypothetical protein
MSTKLSSPRIIKPALIILVIILAGFVISKYLPLIMLSNTTQGFSPASCCITSCGSATNKGNETLLQPTKTDAAINAAIAYYHQKYGSTQVTATAKDFGCHMEVTIFKEGKPVMTLTYLNGQIYEY